MKGARYVYPKIYCDFYDGYSFGYNGFPVAASSAMRSDENLYDFSFVDSEGGINGITVTILDTGDSHVDYFLNGVLIQTAETTLIRQEELSTSSTDGIVKAITVFTDHTSGLTKTVVDDLSAYSFQHTHENITESRAGEYTLQGKIIYNTYYDEISGLEINNKLYVWMDDGVVGGEYKTIRATAGTVASTVISVVAAVLAAFGPDFSSIATKLVFEAALAAGTSIVGGIIQGAVSQRYWTKTVDYNLSVCDTASSRQRIYSAQVYQVLLESGTYSSNKEYEGYLPWRTQVAANAFFHDFWTYPYPGVSSFE